MSFRSPDVLAQHLGQVQAVAHQCRLVVVDGLQVLVCRAPGAGCRLDQAHLCEPRAGLVGPVLLDLEHRSALDLDQAAQRVLASSRK